MGAGGALRALKDGRYPGIIRGVVIWEGLVAHHSLQDSF